MASMKSKDFAEFLKALTELLGASDAATQCRAWQTILPIFNVRPKENVRTICKWLAEVSISGGEQTEDCFQQLIHLTPVIKGFLKTSAKKQIIDDFNVFADTIVILDGRSISKSSQEFVSRFSASSQKKPPKKGPSPPINIEETLATHIGRLKEALDDESAFAKVFDAIKMDKDLKAPELKRLARDFSGRSAKTKVEALDLIWDRHASLVGAANKNKNTGGRTAA